MEGNLLGATGTTPTLSAELLSAATAYRRSGAVFVKVDEGGEMPDTLHEIEGYLLGVSAAPSGSAYAYAVLISNGKEAKYALQLTEEEAKIVLSAIIGAAGNTLFSTYPLFRFSVYTDYRSIKVDNYTPGSLSRYIFTLTPFPITTKVALEAIATSINNALAREEYLTAIGYN